ncbi:MAG: UDP-2,3-diacylglucosamine diphosphatase [Xanthomonadales bacterium]|nr:UDP-2,3-diacylglucosamine diphosphatase [Xanthomonadales bacterium]
MTTLFISDLHLDDSRPESTRQFETLARGEARGAKALYILGDLFEYWLGDDITNETGSRVHEALKALNQSGVSCYFQHGNRDFLVGRDFADSCGLQLLPEEQVIDLYGKQTLLLHGDSLCTDDHEYQAVRKTLRSDAWQEEFLSRSAQGRIDFARDARSKSRAHQMAVDAEIMDVNLDAVEQAFERHRVSHMIHGHTHRPAIHEYFTGQGKAWRTVLGDWYEDNSVLRVGPGRFELGGLTP